MSSNDQSYLRTLRREWGLTQKEVASLLPKSSRNRVSRIERGLVSPNAGEILAYRLVFGARAKDAFPRFYKATLHAVTHGMAHFGRRFERDKSELAERKRELVERVRGRISGQVRSPAV